MTTQSSVRRFFSPNLRACDALWWNQTLNLNWPIRSQDEINSYSQSSQDQKHPNAVERPRLRAELHVECFRGRHYSGPRSEDCTVLYVLPRTVRYEASKRNYLVAIRLHAEMDTL